MESGVSSTYAVRFQCLTGKSWESMGSAIAEVAFWDLVGPQECLQDLKIENGTQRTHLGLLPASMSKPARMLNRFASPITQHVTHSRDVSKQIQRRREFGAPTRANICDQELHRYFRNWPMFFWRLHNRPTIFLQSIINNIYLFLLI
jgi:hypothetical protein